MKDPDQDPLESQLNAYFGARLEEDELEQLNQALRESPEARQRFWERASLEGTLENWGRKRRGEVTALAEVTPSVPWWRQWPVVSGWAAAILVMAVLILQSLPHVSDEEAEIGSLTDPADETQVSDTPQKITETKAGYPVAFLSRMVGVTSESRYLEGQSFGAGEEIKFSEGMMEITLYSGARVVLQGPARFVPNSDLEIAVMEGSVEAEVPESAIGFKVVLPDGVITDFGTRFDFKVEGNQSSRVQVLEGEIELAGSDDGQAARRMFRGEAMTMGESGNLEEVGFAPLSVDRSLKEKADHQARTGMERWKLACRRVDADESVIAHFSMLPEERGNSVIRNQSLKSKTPKSGTVISADWSEGRWPGKPALSFRRPPDRVRVDIPGEFPKATFIVWARIDGLPRLYNGLFYSEYDIKGEVHWQFSSDGGFMFGVRPPNTPPVSAFHRANSESVISPWAFGSWRMLASTYDSENREVIHYVDGDEVSRTIIKDSIPLRFGRATLGNFFDPDFAEHVTFAEIDESWSFRNWTGAIDEFILYSRVLDQKELMDLHEAGRVD